MKLEGRRLSVHLLTFALSAAVAYLLVAWINNGYWNEYPWPGTHQAFEQPEAYQPFIDSLIEDYSWQNGIIITLAIYGALVSFSIFRWEFYRLFFPLGFLAMIPFEYFITAIIAPAIVLICTIFLIGLAYTQKNKKVYRTSAALLLFGIIALWSNWNYSTACWIAFGD